MAKKKNTASSSRKDLIKKRVESRKSVKDVVKKVVKKAKEVIQPKAARVVKPATEKELKECCDNLKARLVGPYKEAMRATHNRAGAAMMRFALAHGDDVREWKRISGKMEADLLK